MVLGTTENLGAVALNDEGDIHDREQAASKLSTDASTLAGPKSNNRSCWPARIDSLKSSSYTRSPRSSAAYSRSLGVKEIPAPPNVSGTAVTP